MTEKYQGPDTKAFDEFIEDYFAESEEHLTAIQSALLSLEDFIHKVKIDSSLIKDLLLHFHSLKGLSAMVAFTELEEISHKVESYLRALLDGNVILTAEAMDTVIASTNLIEEIIAARRKGSDIPAIDLVMEKLRIIMPDETPVKKDEPSVVEKPLGEAENNGSSRMGNDENERELSRPVKENTWFFCIYSLTIPG